MPFERGQTGVVLPVPELEPVVSDWRRRYDVTAAGGVPAHVTVLFPFLPVDELTPPVLARLGRVFARTPAPRVTFHRTARFPDVLYLAPDPEEGVRQMTAALTALWPQLQPYGGVHRDVVPHLTVAHHVDEEALRSAEQDVVRALPVEAELSQAAVYVCRGESWELVARFPLTG